MFGKKCLCAASSIAILGLLSSCAQPATPTPAAPKKGTEAVDAATPAAPAKGAGAVGAATPKPTVPVATPEAAPRDPKYGGTLVLAIKNATDHFDMHQGTAGNIQVPLDPTYSLLLRHDPLNDFKIRGDLAKSWEVSPDGRTYTFHLNTSVKFHNGRALTAEDIKFNFERIIAPPKGMLSPRSELYRNVQQIEAPNASTVRMSLKNTQASFLDLVALPYNFIFAPEVIKKEGDMKRTVIGTGPFKMLDSVFGVSFRAVRNDDYFVKGRPYLDGVTFYTITDEMTRSAALRTNQVSALPLFGAVSTWLSLQLQKSDPSIVLQRRVTPGPNSLIPNTKVAPWSDIRVRRALNLAMDREAASKAIREFQPAYGYMLPGSVWQLPQEEVKGMPGYRQPKDQDIAEAKRLLAEAGYPNGLETPLLISTTIYIQELAQFAQAQLARIGVKINIQALQSGAWRERIYAGSFTLAGYADASAIDDPDILLGEYYLSGSPKNYGSWSNQQFDEKYTLQSKTVDPAKRKEIVWEMERLLYQEVPRIMTVWSTFYAASRAEVKDWHQGSSFFLGNQLQDVWLAK